MQKSKTRLLGKFSLQMLAVGTLALGAMACAHPPPPASPPPPPSGPTAADLQTAHALFADAMNDEEAQNWEQAREKLEKAGGIKMTPSIRFHLGLCEEQLKLPCEALNNYIGAVNQARDNDDSEVLIASIEGLSRLSARLSVLKTFSPTATGHIGVQCQPRDGGDAFRAQAEARQEEGVKRHSAGDVRAPGWPSKKPTPSTRAPRSCGTWRWPSWTPDAISTPPATCTPTWRARTQR